MISIASMLMLALAAAPAQSQSKPKLLVLELTAAGGVDRAVASALTEALTNEVSARGFFSVISAKDIQTMLGVERQKQQLGCKEESTCLAELGGAVGARFILSGTVAKLGGNAFQLTLQTIDTERSQPIGRSTRMAGDVAALTRTLAYAVAEATAQPPPPEPSRLPSYLLIGGGSALGLLGGVVGVVAFSTDAGLQRELNNQGVLPTTFASYQQEVAAVGFQKNLSLAAILAGAALVGGGIWLLPNEGAGAPRVALGATPGGVGLVGAWP